MTEPDEIERAAETIRQRLCILTALHSSLDRADEVLTVIRASRDQDEATRAAQDFLGLEGIQAQAVLFQQWVGLTSQRADDLRRDIKSEHRALASLIDGNPDDSQGV